MENKKRQSEDLNWRELSARVVLFHSAVAERLGLNTTDFKALDLLYRLGTSTAGGLAEATGLTTGAVTGIVDRLEAAGLVRRIRSDSDRRQVAIEPVEEKAKEVSELFSPLHKSVAAFAGKYSSEELRLVGEFLSGITDILKRETVGLRAEKAP